MQRQTIGRYQILDEIASGSQGAVYRARNGATGQIVALKVLHPHMSRDANVVERFRREAQLAAGVNHPNVTKIFEVGTDGDVHYIAMEFLPKSLGEVIASEGQLPIERAVDICRQTALALNAASKMGITHRDIKPQNLLIAADGSVKVADFGIARWSGFESMTNAGDVLGTPKYMSPEQALGQRADARSDIYALGVVLYEALSGQVPFDSDSPYNINRQHIEVTPEPVSARRGDIPPELSRVAARCLEKDPASRFQTAVEFIRAIDQAMMGSRRRSSDGLVRPDMPKSPSAEGDVRVIAGASAGAVEDLGVQPAPEAGAGDWRSGQIDSNAGRGTRRKALTIAGILGAALVAVTLVAIFAFGGGGSFALSQPANGSSGGNPQFQAPPPVAGAPAQTTAATDRDALVALYNSTNGNVWRNNDNWLSQTPIGQWHGVTTDANGRVTKIDLRENQLSGWIPPELGNLSKLEWLYLRDNQLRRQIPPELASLSTLEGLVLHGNRLRGQIPPELGNLSNLHSLDLSRNQLGGQIPPELGNLSNLENLALYETQLDGQIPPELGNLAKLQNLALSDNQLSGQIPPELGSLAKLQNLALWSNNLSGQIPPELGNLSNLENLALYETQLDGRIPPELGNLAKLQNLALWSNNLSGQIPPELGNLAKLQNLALWSNNLSGQIPPELANLTKLEALEFRSNSLGGCVPASLRSAYREGELPFCPGGGVIPPSQASQQAVSSDRESLVALYDATNGANWTRNSNWLSPSPLEEWHGVTTDANGRVKGLYLSDNQLSGQMPPELGNLSNLWWMGLSENQLSGQIPQDLGNLSNLGSLWLGENQLSGEIPPELGNLAKLIYLSLSGNQLSGEIPPELGNLAKLYYLSLSGNQLDGCAPASLRGAYEEGELPFC